MQTYDLVSLWSGSYRESDVLADSGDLVYTTLILTSSLEA
jgi:hypothetical protein